MKKARAGSPARAEGVVGRSELLATKRMMPEGAEAP
jgi:hypothetical protein